MYSKCSLTIIAKSSVYKILIFNELMSYIPDLDSQLQHTTRAANHTEPDILRIALLRPCVSWHLWGWRPQWQSKRRRRVGGLTLVMQYGSRMQLTLFSATVQSKSFSVLMECECAFYMEESSSSLKALSLNTCFKQHTSFPH